MRGLIRRVIADRRAATAVEYGLIVALITIALLGGLVLLGGAVMEQWGDIATKFPTL